MFCTPAGQLEEVGRRMAPSEHSAEFMNIVSDLAGEYRV